MKDHALPQDVTGYKFHIIGNMTLKQFAEVAAGVGVGFLIYFTNLPDLIKWPLILTFAGVGALAAFVPFEERPLDHWIMSLFKALYRPTQFYWKRMSKIPESLLYESKTELHTLVKEVDLTPARRQRVKEYLHSVVPTEENDSIQDYTNQRLNEVMTVFDQVVYQPQPELQIQPDQLAQPEYAPMQPSFATEPAIAEIPQPEPMAAQMTEPIAQPMPVAQAAEPAQAQAAPNWPDAQPTSIPANEQANSVSFKQTQKQVDPNANVPLSISQGFVSGVEIKTKQSNSTSVNDIATAANLLNQGVSVPQAQGISVARTQLDDFGPRTSPQNENQVGDTYITSQNLNTNQGPQATQMAVQDKTLPFPAKPTQPNKIVGMSIDSNNVPLSNVIIEILTPEGIPARAVKTNILGQFFITTPLGNGTYTISAEKAGYTFPPQSLELTGQVLDPIEVRSQ